MSTIHLVNPSERDWCTQRWILAFEQTRLMVWGCSLEYAVEQAAEWLAEHEPGHVMAHDSDELRERLADAFAELRDELVGEGEVSPHVVTLDSIELEGGYRPDWMDRVEDRAATGLQYTEAGYLDTSWQIVCTDPTRAELMAMRGHGDTFAYTTPES